LKVNRFFRGQKGLGALEKSLKMTIICFAPDKKISSWTFKIKNHIGILMSLRERERERNREKEKEKRE
jgi:hypothetical protein